MLAKCGSKNEYLRAEEAAKGVVYDAKRVAEQVRFGEVLIREDNRMELFKTAKRMFATNREVIGENSVKNDKVDLAVTDREKLLARTL